ncbi:MAG TPA: SPOR domain-containing protein [Methylotenera sp.]|nr:SPOR domain-containing protein [Methylotenera sp.]
MPPDLPNEQELILKKRARRRLVGAIALVLLMIIILPRILQDRANLAPQEAIKITMPERQADNYSSSVVPVAPEVSSDLAPEVAVNPQVSEVANEASEAKVETENPKPVVKVEKEVVAKVTAPKAIEPKATPAPVNDQPKATDSFTVQVGVYSDIANVKQLQEKLKQAGYASRTEKVSTPNGEKIRLRAGKFPSRQEAANALTKIQAAGLSGMVISHE